MEAVIFAIVVIVAIVRGIFRLLKWATQALKRMSSPGPTYIPPQAMSPQAAPMAQPPAFAGKPAPLSRPPLQSAYSEPVVTRSATTADFQSQESALVSYEQQSEKKSRRTPDSQSAAASSAESPLLSAPLFGSTSDLVRSLILQEVLGPPLSRRRHSNGD